jgi:hypothetical protein
MRLVSITFLRRSYCATCDAAFFAWEEMAVLGETDEAFSEIRPEGLPADVKR